MRRHSLPGRRGRSLSTAPRWRLAAPPDPEVTRGLAAALKLPEPLAALLVQRGFGTASSARDFLRPPLDAMADPGTLAGMSAAVATIAEAVRGRETILVHGDYDVDGQCATALLVRILRLAGADVHGFVPHRIADGYDFGDAGLAEAARLGAGLIITCDCGITALDTVARAKAAGHRVVVTDHHLPGGGGLPAADAVVDPQRPDDTSGLDALCGTGIAFKLAQALVEPLGLSPHAPLHLLDYVAVATVADVVPLVGENRTLVKHGLRLLADSRWAGWRALMQQTGLVGKEVRAGQVGFILAPRLNAVGRIGDAKDGLRLLLSDDDREATALAEQLERCNRERQAMDQVILEEALLTVERDYPDPESHRALVLAADGWHPGVIGIVASRVVERFGRPTFLIGLDGATGKGSGRSIAAFDLHSALDRCGDLLERFGGHRMAAGLTIRREQVPAFRERFTTVARELLPVEALGSEQRVDLELELGAVDDALERLVRHLEPCGMGNPAPVFGLRRVTMAESRVVGGNHLKARLTAHGTTLDAIAFNWADRATPLLGAPVDVTMRLERNSYQGRSGLQARVLTIAPAGS